LEDKGGVVGEKIQDEVGAIFKNAYGYPWGQKRTSARIDREFL